MEQLLETFAGFILMIIVPPFILVYLGAYALGGQKRAGRATKWFGQQIAKLVRWVFDSLFRLLTYLFREVYKSIREIFR